MTLMTEFTSKDLYSTYKVREQAQGTERRIPYIDAWIRCHMPQDRSAIILDIGCGRGLLLSRLQRFGYTALRGVDASPSQYQHRVTDITELCDAMEALRAISTGSQDVVIAFDVIEHLSTKDLLSLSAEVYRVLRTTGRWVVHVPNGSGLFGTHALYGDLTHERAFTQSSLNQLAEISGFRRIAAFEDVPCRHGVLSWCRWLVWRIGRVFLLFLWAAETGSFSDALFSQNFTAVFWK